MGEQHENGAGLQEGFDENNEVTEDELVQIEDEGVVYNCAVLAIAESEGQEYAMLAPAEQLSDAEEEGETIEALEAYESAVELDPNHPAALFRLGALNVPRAPPRSLPPSSHGTQPFPPASMTVTQGSSKSTLSAS